MHLNRLKLLSALLALMLSGCIGGGTSPASNFYLLEPVTETKQPGPSDDARISIGLRPVGIPDYVDRPQLVTATDKNAYHLSEFNRWAEALDYNITRVLARNLTVLTPADVWLTRSSRFAQQAAFRLAVDIHQFHIDPQGQAVLAAQWTVSSDRKLLLNRQMSYRVEASNSDYRLMVAALNDCLDRLSEDIAQSLRQLNR
ncbi:PqiC family protein [Methylomarinum sp. Ch1-1]|uniref:PqiC family protein n=1 Tax=Methylomarinum roseum TaxID=3067653 RepID=A0AAU7NVS6_9GAMM|nr:PqiC family protein [Methylomarinum sp. Ch1-1]MDP4522894.1 PqiC family protein [Methylomarinum sp. Ch1-1]